MFFTVWPKGHSVLLKLRANIVVRYFATIKDYSYTFLNFVYQNGIITSDPLVCSIYTQIKDILQNNFQF
jgi:Cu2+-containing amine oxidase